MRYCIPDELFNRVPVHRSTADMADAPLDDICREIYYKLPKAEKVEVLRETWHTMCDFCARTGALVERLSNSENPSQIPLTPSFGKFLWIVGAEVQPTESDEFQKTADFGVRDTAEGMLATFDSGVHGAAVFVSVRPEFSSVAADANGDFAAKVPRYMVDKYGECVAHGSLARLYAMRGDAGMARMHATAYNNDLNRLAFGLVTSGMRKHLLIDVEDWLVNTQG